MYSCTLSFTMALHVREINATPWPLYSHQTEPIRILHGRLGGCQSLSGPVRNISLKKAFNSPAAQPVPNHYQLRYSTQCNVHAFEINYSTIFMVL